MHCCSFILVKDYLPLLFLEEAHVPLLLSFSQRYYHIIMTAANSSVDFNSPDFNANLCTLQTCPLAYASVDYVPNLAGNALYLALFSLFLVIQVFLGIRYRTWGYMVGLVGGLVLEIIGYVARVQMHYNPFLSNPFLMYIHRGLPPNNFLLHAGILSA